MVEGADAEGQDEGAAERRHGDALAAARCHGDEQGAERREDDERVQVEGPAEAGLRRQMLRPASGTGRRCGLA
jgi:hypothetical protein